MYQPLDSRPSQEFNSEGEQKLLILCLRGHTPQWKVSVRDKRNEDLVQHSL